MKYILWLQFPHLLPPSSLTLFPDKTFFPAYKPRLARLVTARVNDINPNGILLTNVIEWRQSE